MRDRQAAPPLRRLAAIDKELGPEPGKDVAALVYDDPERATIYTRWADSGEPVEKSLMCACGMPWEPDMDQFGCWSCGAEALEKTMNDATAAAVAVGAA